MRKADRGPVARKGESAMEWLWDGKRDSSRRTLLKLFLLLSVLVWLPTGAAAAQDSSTVVIPRQSIAHVPSPLSLEIFPGFDVPLGDSSQRFRYSGGVDLGPRYRMELPRFRGLVWLKGGPP